VVSAPEVIVIGAGPAGLAAAAELGRLGIPAAVLEQADSAGAAWRGRYDGRSLAANFKPAKVVYAILLPNGKQLTPDTLFPFSQATLAHAARILGTYGIEVEVAGIPAA
jgi:2-polyprenyl-6-methoxyphenol hydroxylase-like FAD-dependent oxidoreductase